MIIGTKRDPATPYDWAVALSKKMSGSILLSLNADGHTGQNRGFPCVDRAVEGYLFQSAPEKPPLPCSLIGN